MKTELEELLARLEAWKLDPVSQVFELDIYDACELLEPLLRAALHLPEEKA